MSFSPKQKPVLKLSQMSLRQQAEYRNAMKLLYTPLDREVALEPLPEPPAPRVRRAAPGASEAEIQRAILQYLKVRGHLAFRINTQGIPLWKEGAFTGFRRAPQVGMPDVIGVCRKRIVTGADGKSVVEASGRLIALEIKSLLGKATEAQLSMLEKFKEYGAIAGVVRSVADVEKLGL